MPNQSVALTELTGETPPDANPSRLEMELATEQLEASCADAMGVPVYDAPIPEDTLAEHIDFWPMLDNLEGFGKLAAEINATGEATFASISY